jgi:hypothetical protein
MSNPDAFDLNPELQELAKKRRAKEVADIDGAPTAKEYPNEQFSVEAELQKLRRKRLSE